MRRKSLYLISILVFVFLQCNSQNEQAIQLKVLSYNIHHGENIHGEIDILKIAEIIRNCDADLVALQEVDRNAKRSGAIDIATKLGELTKLIPIYGSTMPFDGGEYGLAILSKHSITSTKFHRLSSPIPSEPRGALEAIVQVSNGSKIRFICTHLDHNSDPANRTQQAKELNEFWQFDNLPSLILGDLNATVGSQPMDILLSQWNYADLSQQATSPAPNPRSKIDYVLYDQYNSWKVKKVDVLEEGEASDHRPLLATMELFPDQTHGYENEFSSMPGLIGAAWNLGVNPFGDEIDLSENPLNHEKDFSISFWLKSEASGKERFNLISTKQTTDNSLQTQKQQGWSIFYSGGTFAWNLGDGARRLLYERDNGAYWPINDQKWHLLTMTHNAEKKEVRLYYDDQNVAIYNINDGKQMDFGAGKKLFIGSQQKPDEHKRQILPIIEEGAKNLQVVLNAFNDLGYEPLTNEDLITLASDPKKLYLARRSAKYKSLTKEKEADIKAVLEKDLEPILKARSVLMKNPYTIYQSKDYQLVGPLVHIYSIKDGEIKINEESALAYGEKEYMGLSNCLMNDLRVDESTLSAQQVKSMYRAFNKTAQEKNTPELKSITAAVWNIHHGGIHYTKDHAGWDSRDRIVDMIRANNADVVMMQETYSNGDYIAAQLGYYFATSVDWDYLNQGTNISVLSRFPIKDIYVPDDASFNNVAALIELSPGQEIYVISNWYGMNKFEDVYNYHIDRFSKTDDIPILLAGDFNAVPHTDGGSSPASKKLIENGFTDAYRSTYTNVKQDPGPTHRSGSRIDQLYFKGKKLENTSIEVISTHPGGFPSDHFLIIGTFKL